MPGLFRFTLRRKERRDGGIQTTGEKVKPKQNGWVTHYYQVKCNNCGGEGGWHEEEQYECEHDCGYVGSYVDVERHELTCPYLVDDY